MPQRLEIIYTGGTLGMQASDQGLVPATGLAGRLNAALDDSPEYKGQLQQIEWSLTENTPLLDSANIRPADWEIIAEQVLDSKTASGIVIIHGTDTLAYTASALSFLLQGIEIPVVLTGSQKPLGVEHGDALDNLVGAMLASQSAEQGVWVYFHQQLMSGARVVKMDAISFAGFSTPRLTAPVGESDRRVSVCWQPNPRDWDSIQVSTVHMVPGYDATQLMALIHTQPDAIILSLFGVGTLADKNETLLTALEAAQKQDIVVVAISQCYIGHIDFSVYATGAKLSELGVLNGRDITLEAAYTKLMVLFRLGYSTERVKQLFEQNIANEMSATDK